MRAPVRTSAHVYNICQASTTAEYEPIQITRSRQFHRISNKEILETITTTGMPGTGKYIVCTYHKTVILNLVALPAASSKLAALW